MKNNEKQILNLIRYLPVLLVLLISSILTFYLYYQNIERFKKESESLESKYISINKELIQFQIQRIKQNILLAKQNNIKRLKNQLKMQVDNAYSIAYSLYMNNQDKSKLEISKLIKDALRDIRFNQDRGYLFIYQSNGINILHPIKHNLENKNLWNYQDKKGTYLLKEMNKILKTRTNTYYTWYWTKTGDNRQLEKLGYFKKFAPFDWFIGTGEYIDDFEKELKLDLAEDISNYRYKKDGYVFVLDYDGTYISYYNKDFIGRKIKDYYISNDSIVLKNKMRKIAKNEADYITYIYKNKPSSNKGIEKISYIDGINDWKWIIGTGFYMDDFYEKIKTKKEELMINNSSELTKILIVCFIVTFVCLIIFIYISKILEINFKNYTKQIENQINENQKKDNILAHQSKMAAMGEMIENISHQWRQPLSTISTISTGIKLQKDMGIIDNDMENESLTLINKHVQHLSQTIDDFRNFFKINKDKTEFNLKDLFKKVFVLNEVQFNQKDIIVITEINDINLCTLENELIQVLLNILNNSKDALMNIDKQRYLFINTFIKEDSVVIEIKDNAGGINDKIIDKIFEPYFTTKGDTQGTGIGLFMSKEIIIKNLNGNIQASNVSYEYHLEEYKGALFSIIIPLVNI